MLKPFEYPFPLMMMFHHQMALQQEVTSLLHCNAIMTSFAVVSSENSLVSGRSQSYILRK